METNLTNASSRSTRAGAAKAHLAGRSCGFPQAFVGAMHTLLKAKDYTAGVRANILAGGDNCCRASVRNAV